MTQKVTIAKDKLDSLSSTISEKSGKNGPFTISKMKDIIEDYLVNPIGTKNITSNGTYNVNQYKTVLVNVEGGGTLGTKTINQNGTYSAENDSLDGYYEVTVNVPSSSPTLQTKTVTPTTSQQSVTPDTGYDGLSSVTVNAMPSGSMGTPTATKGSVSNHSVSVTPSVTNTAGYITGGTVNGTAVSVSASELVSGSETKTANGTYDVTNLAELVVDVPPTTPNLQSKTVSPSESQQTVTADSGYDGLSAVTVNAISSTYVGTEVSRQGATTITPSTSQQTAVAAGKYTTGAVTVAPIPSNYIIPSGNLAITENGTGIDVSQYETVSVSVSGGEVNIDTKTATASNYPTSLQFTGMKGQPKMFALKSTSQISSSGSTTYYYIIDMVYNGTTTVGNCFRIGSTRRVDTIASGYSWSYSGTTLTLTTSASSRSSSPGAFNNGYQLIYVY